MKIATFPHMGDYHVIFRGLLEDIGVRVMNPPPMTKRTLELGCKHSPEAACVPFKYTLGNFIEALEKGANLIVQAGGGCRFGFYAEIQETILRDLGYQFEFKRIFQGFGSMISDLKSINPNMNSRELARVIALNYLKLTMFDRVDSLIRENISYEVEKGSYEKLRKSFLRELARTKTMRGVFRLRRKTLGFLKHIRTRIPDTDLKVGIVGELYMVMEPFSNYFLEREMARMGIKVKRFVTLSTILHEAFGYRKKMRRYVHMGHPYIKHHLGAHGTESVAKSLYLINKGYDGIIHLKPFGCMPEINAMSALHRISKDKKVPIMHLSFDEQTSETGIGTRLEAFHDMLRMRANR